MLSPIDPTVNSTGTGACSDYRKKRIKNVQKLELVRMMKANFLFIRGKHAVVRSDRSRGDVWKAITARLNSLGPPVQSAEAWQRRWNDMRSATKSKMAKIQSYVREHGEGCPYKLTLVERLIWDTFSVKPEDYMKDLNMKLWREKQNLEYVRQSAVVDSTSKVPGTEPGLNTVWNNTPPSNINLEAGGGWNPSAAYTCATRQVQRASMDDVVLQDLDRTKDPFSTQSFQAAEGYGAHQPVCGVGYSASSNSLATQMSEWPSVVATPSSEVASESSDLLPGSKALRELNKLLDQVLRQNEEILNLLQQTNHQH